MMVATPGVDGDGAETTATYEVGCGDGPLLGMGVTTDRYVLPQPAIRAAAARTEPA
jgi:hypothetical protein